MAINEKLFLVYKDGAIQSLGSKRTDGKRLTPINRKGYLYINIFSKWRHKQKAIHRMVAETYLPNPHNKPQVNHKNGIKTDNRVENLEWVTGSENTKHAVDTGLIKKRFGQDNHQSKLTNEQRAYIKRLLIFGATQKAIAALYGVSRSLICNNK